MPNTQFIEDHKQENLEIALDHLCKATGRDIAIFFPTKADEIVPYLLKEIAITLKDQTPLMPFFKGDIFNEAKLEEANILLFSIIETDNEGNYKTAIEKIRAEIEKRFNCNPNPIVKGSLR
jgi:hypothetical protein